MSRRILRAAILLLAAEGTVYAADDMTAELARYVAGHLGASVVECSQQARALHPDRFMVCAAYGRSWSRFKSDWEFVRDRFDQPVSAEAQSAWTRKAGRYERQYRVEKSDVTVVFDEKQGLLLFAYTPEGLDDPAAMAGRSGGEEKKPRVAGFGGVTVPRLLDQGRVEPAYPEPAAGQGIEGSVALAAVILEDGTVGKLEILSEEPEGFGLGEAALAAVRHWLYEPARFEGRPVDVALTIYVPFKPPQEAEP